MKADATEHEVANVVAIIKEMGFHAHSIPGAQRIAIGITGNKSPVDPSRFENVPKSEEAINVSKPYKLISLDLKPERTIVKVGSATIGGEELTLIAGPCAVENRDQAFRIAEVVHKSGAKFFRGGVFKPRTPSTAFQGLGEEGLEILAEVREKYGLRIVTEVINENSVEMAENYVDIIQISPRNMQNFPLLRRVGRSNCAVLLKRGQAATLDEWLLAAEYIMVEGNYNVVLCECGIRAFTGSTLNTLDLAVIPALRCITHLPVLIDPSHGTGKSYMVTPLARGGIAVGADGLMVELHHNPLLAIYDGAEALTFEQYDQLILEARAIRRVITI